MYNVIISVPVRIAKGNEISAECQRDHEGWTHEHDLTFGGYFEWCILKTLLSTWGECWKEAAA